MVGTPLACSDDGNAGNASDSTGTAATVAPGSDDQADDSQPDDGQPDDGQNTMEPGSTETDGPADSTGQPDDDTAGSDSSDGTGGRTGSCDAGAFTVCEDFEDAAIGENPDGWELRASGVFGGNGMGVADDQAVSGTQSFRLQSGESGAQWLTYQGDISAFADGHWGRMMFRMGAPVPWPAGGVIHGDLFEARGDWQGSTHQVRWAVINNASMLHNWGYNVQTSNAGEFIHETGYTFPWTEDWLCIEWHHDQLAQTATLWVDGAETLAVTAGDDPQLPTFDDISVGWANYQPAAPEFIVHIDDVALHTERIGCPD